MKTETMIVAGFVLLAQSAFGQTVELKSIDQTNTLTGDIIGYDGELVTLDTPTGIIQVPSLQLRCVSENCPTNIAWAEDDRALIIEFSAPAYQDLVSKLAQQFFESEDVNATTAQDSEFILRDVTGVAVSVKFAMQDDAQAVLDTEADFVVSDYRFDDAVRAEYDEALAWASEPEPARQLIASDAFSVVVSPGVGVSGITLESLARVFSGDLSNWSELGGADVPILPLKRQIDADTTRGIDEIIMKPTGLEVSETILTVASDEDIVSTLEQLPGGIAVVDVAVSASSSKLGIIGQCGAVVGADEFTIKSGDYPLIRPLLARAVSGERPGPLTDLFDFAATQLWQSDLTEDALINRAIIIQRPEDKAERVNAILASGVPPEQHETARAMIEALFEATPLSLTLQDNAITQTIAAHNRDAIIRLRDAVTGGAFDQAEIMFVGYSPQGDVLGVRASENSAQEVLSAFLEFAPELAPGNPHGVTFSAVGFGSIAPINCHTGPLSSAEGNRVEVWIKQLVE